MVYRFVVPLVFFAVFAVPREEVQVPSFVVIVNADNPVTTISSSALSAIFLKRTLKWTNGTSISAVDCTRSSPIREAFSKTVHGRSASGIVTFWQQQIFSGKDTPPPEKRSDADIIAFVRANPGGIGYVVAGTELGTGVKTVTLSNR